MIEPTKASPAIAAIQQAVSLVNQYHESDESENYLKRLPPPNELEIAKVEKDLGNKLPDSYKYFLRHYGTLEFMGLELTGTHQKKLNGPRSVITQTRSNRKNLKLRQFAIVVHSFGDGCWAVLDTSRMIENECPVILWDPSSAACFIKPHIYAENFGQYLLNMVKEELEFLKTL
ncbi:SMI1/KNR4 family protein [Hellea sp.]|nr:SMI1/KNR4 family protein [Hellea sp.]